MEGDVLGDVVPAGAVDALDLIAEGFQPGLVLGGGVFGGGCGDLRFEGQPHVEQLEGQLVLVVQPGQAQRVLGQGAVALDVGAVPAAHLQHPLGGQPLDRLPDGAAPHLKHLAQLKFVGHFFPDGDGSLQNIVHQSVFDLRAQQFAFHSSYPRSVVCEVY